MKLSFIPWVLLLVFCSCNENKSTLSLLTKTLKKIEKGTPYYLKLEVIDDCSCTITQDDGELIDQITTKVFWGELDKIDTLSNHKSKTYTSYFDFEEGKGIDIVNLIPLDSAQIPKLPELYKEIKKNYTGFSFRHETYEEQKIAIKNLKKIAIKCGASITTN